MTTHKYRFYSPDKFIVVTQGFKMGIDEKRKYQALIGASCVTEETTMLLKVNTDLDDMYVISKKR